MVEKYIKQQIFENQEDFNANFKINVPEQFNFAYDIVDEWAKINPEKKALCWVNDQGEHIDFTFREMKENSDAVASYFQSIGIEKGDRVMLILKRRYWYWFVILALHKIGAVAIPATHQLTKKDIVYRCKSADIKAIVGTGETLVTKHVDEALPESPTLKYRISVGPDVPAGWLDIKKGIKDAPAFVKPSSLNTNSDIMLLYFTSGTTGNPKMVIHNYIYPLGHIITSGYWQNLKEDSLHLTLADTGWAKAAWGKLYGQWIMGACIFVYDHEKFTASDLLKVMQDYRISSFCAPPTVYRFLIKEDLSQYDLSALKYCEVAGEPLNPSVFDTFYKATGLKLMEGFGQTETTVTIANFPWMNPKPGSMGMPSPAYDMDLITPDGRSAEAGEHGEIIFRTNRSVPVGLFMGYYRDKELTDMVYRNNVYHTGDIAWRDEDGYYWFVGRNDDVIKSSGYRIGPFEVESALMTHPAVVECAVTGVPDDIRGQVVKATIILAHDYKEKSAPELIKDIQDHVKKNTAPYKYPRIIEFVDELPKTISGKIRRVQIRAEDTKTDS
ncbi:MAG: AMP-binding protein [Dysgonamonadaceae bacterium]|jgi:acetyl-CoA synthetase|nr:AMP-binding protein [Dysgonamonadaceae bacterium]